MDIGGAILAKEIALGRVVTVSVTGITFLKPVAVGDVVCCYAARCLKPVTLQLLLILKCGLKSSNRAGRSTVSCH